MEVEGSRYAGLRDAASGDVYLLYYEDEVVEVDASDEISFDIKLDSCADDITFMGFNNTSEPPQGYETIEISNENFVVESCSTSDNQYRARFVVNGNVLYTTGFIALGETSTEQLLWED